MLSKTVWIVTGLSFQTAMQVQAGKLATTATTAAQQLFATDQQDVRHITKRHRQDLTNYM